MLSRFRGPSVLLPREPVDTELREDRLRLRLVDSPPIPFPPEPLRSLAVDVVRHELDRADRDGGRRSVILRTLDAMGIGFDS